MLRVARLIAAKDLRIELRSRVVTNQVLPFAGIVMVMFAFALNTDTIVERVAPGLVWLATLFSLLILVQRAFAIETADGATDAMRAAGVDPAGIFLGKTAALAAQLAVLEVVLLVIAVVLYRTHLRPTGIVLLVATFLAVLELTRLRKLQLRQNEAFSDIWCDAVDENPLETVATAGTLTA